MVRRGLLTGCTTEQRQVTLCDTSCWSGRRGAAALGRLGLRAILVAEEVGVLFDEDGVIAALLQHYITVSGRFG